MDQAALDVSRARLAGTGATVTAVPGNAVRQITRLGARGPYDVILVGGLLHYLPERAARVILDRAVSVLRPRGLLGATNIVAGHPWRFLLELIADWKLIGRDRDDARPSTASTRASRSTSTRRASPGWSPSRRSR